MSELKIGEGELSDVFEKSEPAPEVQETVPEKGVTDVEPPSTGEQPADDGEGENALLPKAVVIDERKRRQAAEDKAAALERELQGFKNKPEPKAEKPATDLFAEPEKWQQELESRMDMKYQNREIQRSSNRLIKQIGQDAFEQITARFAELAQANPALVQQMRNDDDPAEFARSYVTKHDETDAIMRDPVAYKEKLKQEILAELQPQTSKPKAKLPPSLATANGVKHGEEETVPNDLADIFPELR